MPDPIPGLPSTWQQFCLAVFFMVVAPLSALLIDLTLKGEVPVPDIYLTMALFIIGLGTSSKSVALLGLSILLSAGYLIAYGSVATLPDCPHLPGGETLGSMTRHYAGGIAFLILNLAERYNRHVATGELFWDFG